MLFISDILIRSISGYIFIAQKNRKKAKLSSYCHCVFVLLLPFWNFDCNRNWLYKQDKIPSQYLSNSVSWYDNRANRYHAECYSICSTGNFSAVAI